MSDRRVRNTGRPIYGCPQPVRGPRRASFRPRLGLIPRRLLILGVLIIVVVLGLRQLTAITTITVTSPSRGPEITVEAKQSLEKSWRQSNLITFDASALQAALLQADPLLRTVSIHRAWPHTIRLAITIKEPSLGWSTGNQSYLLDRDGAVIGALPSGSKLPVVIDGSNLPVQLGQRVATSRFVEFTTQIAAAVATLNLGPSQLQVKETTLDLYVTTTKGYRLIFDTGRAANGEIADLKVVLANLAAQKRTPAQYIDLRIDGKAYYQ